MQNTACQVYFQWLSDSEEVVWSVCLQCETNKEHILLHGQVLCEKRRQCSVYADLSNTQKHLRNEKCF